MKDLFDLAKGGKGIQTPAAIKYVTFHVPNKLINWFLGPYEESYEQDYSFDTAGGGFGSDQLLREWQLDFMPTKKRYALLKTLFADIKKRGWTSAQLGKTLEVYVK